MMLSALYELAKSRRLLDNPDYVENRVDYIIRIDESGSFLGLIPTADENGKAATKLVPRLPKRASNINAAFLVDNAKYVLGAGVENNPGRNALCAAAFAARISDLAAVTRDAGAIAVQRFLERRDQHRPTLDSAKAEEWTGSEWLAFALDGDGAKLVHDRERIREYWVGERTKTDGSAHIRCLVTGGLAEPERLHANIKRLRGAQTSGAALVSFNSPAFASYGLEQGANAPVSRAAAEGYVAALNWLLESDGTKRHRYGVSLGGDAVTVFWARESHDKTADVLLSLLAPSEEEVTHFAASAFRGLEPAPLDASAFYAVTLSGNAARVVVRDWVETTVDQVKRNVRRYFDDLRLSGDDGRPRPVHLLLKSLEAPGRDLEPTLAARFISGALRGTPFPREIIGAALRRLRLPASRNDRFLVHDRIALIKATWLRLKRPDRREGDLVALDESNTQPPYLLGRLFAVLERLQAAALGDINATIRDRFFGAASATPAIVFPRLLRNAVHHAAKAEHSGWLEKIEGRIMALLPATRFPAAMPLEDQGLFAVGYYHQRERFFEKRGNTNE